MMTLKRRQFDYAEFVEGYRAACEPWGIDPARGATGYQVVHVLAERQRRLWEVQGWAERRWWLDHEFWLDSEPDRSDTEADALWQLFVQAYSLTARLIVRAGRLRRAAGEAQMRRN